MAVVKTKFSPRNRVVTMRLKAKTEEILKRVSSKNGFSASQYVDLLIQWSEENMSKCMKDLKEMQELENPGRE